MKMKEWRYRFYEDEDIDLDDIETINDIEADDAISQRDSWKNTKENSISQSQIQSLVKSEIQKQMKSSSLDKSGEASKETKDIAADKQQKGAEEHSLYQQRLGQHKSSQHLPHHQGSSQIAFPLSKKGHRHKGKGRHIYSQPRAKVPPRPLYDVVYRELERVNIYPSNKGTLIPFNHSILGNYVLFSPIWGTDTADTNMKRVHRLMTSLFNFKHQFLPIYTYDKGELIDITFAIFPRKDDEKAFANLLASVKGIIKRQQSGSYVECVDGFHTLISEKQKVHYAFRDIDTILNNYTRDRGVGVMGGLSVLIHPKHYLNPYPQSREECLYRSKTGEIWEGKIQVKSV